MISRSLLLNIPAGNIAGCLEAFGIARKNISSYEQGEPFLEVQENGAFVSSVKGDFTHAVDVFLFDRELQAIVGTLTEFSLKGILSAMPDDDDDDDDPEVFFYGVMGSDESCVSTKMRLRIGCKSSTHWARRDSLENTSRDFNHTRKWEPA